MKVVLSNPVLVLTKEEMVTLGKAAVLLQSICDENNDFGECDYRCPLACYCEKRQHHTIADYLSNIVSKCEKEE